MRLVVFLVLLALVACKKESSDMGPVGLSDKPGLSTPAADQAIPYRFDSLDDRPVSSDTSGGKPTILCFVTTGDIVGQAQVDYLVAMAKNDGTKVNYALVALHPRKELMLVDAYAHTLKVEFPVALGDSKTLAAGGPFGEIAAVPTLVVLDARNRLVWKHTGLAKPEELRSHLKRAE